MRLDTPPRFLAMLLLACAALIPFRLHAATDIETGKQKAWDMLERAATSKRTGDRASGIRALGLLRENPRARNLAKRALEDSKPEVRAAAATALGQMHATEAIPWLQKMLSDQKLPVVMAAAHALRDLKDEASAYAVYYDLLTGARKSGDGLIAQQMQTLHDPKELARIGFSEGIGFVPFAGIGWDAYRVMHKKDPNPARAVAASFLAHDPDPATAEALVHATQDKNWIVRAAAVEALAERGDPSLQGKIERSFDDRNVRVRYTAAAAVIRLSGIAENRRDEKQVTAEAASNAGK